MSLSLNPLQTLAEKITAANALGLKIKSAKSDKDDNVRAILDGGDDARIVKFREARQARLDKIATLQAEITNAEANIKEYAVTLIPGVDANFDVDAATKEFLGLRKDVTEHSKAILKFGISEEDLAAALQEMGIGQVIDLRGTGSKSATVGDTKRPRIATATVNGENVWSDKEQTKVNFTDLAKSLGSDADTVKKAAFVAAGTEDLNSLEPGTAVSFTFADKTVVVTISANKPGRKKSENVETPAETPAE